MKPETEPAEPEMRLAGTRYAVGRYCGYRRRDEGGPADTLRIFFDRPREVVRVEGFEDVELALAEVRAALEPDDRPGLWRDW